jgi:hypothetical protein
MKGHPKEKRLKVSAFVFFLAFAIRLLFILETMDIPAFRTPNPGMDIDLHWQAARLIAQGATTSEPYFELMMCSTPLHQYWLAFWQVILGESLILHRLLNALIASISAVLMFWLMVRLVRSRLVALICSIAWAALPSLVYFDATLHKSALEIMALLLLMHALLTKPGSTRNLFYIGKGVVIGTLLAILLLLQMNTFLYCIIAAASIALDRCAQRRERLWVLISVLLIFTSTFVFYQFRGGLFERKYPWFLPQKGIHFRIGFHKGAHGAYHQLGGIKPWPYGHVFQSRLNAEARAKKPMTPEEADRFFIRESLDFIFNNPGESLKIIATKIGLFFNNYEIKGIDDLYYLKTQSKTLAYTPLGLGLLVLFAGLGVMRLISLREYRILFLLVGFLAVMLASNVLIFVTWRYRLNNVVPLMLLAAFGLQYLQAHTFEFLRSEKPLGSKLLKYCCSVLLPLAICGWIAYRPVLEDYRQGFFKRAAYNDKLSRSAEKLISHLAVLEQSDPQGLEIIAQKALILNRLHRHTNSYRLLKMVHEEGFYHPFVTFRYLVYLLWLGNYDEAVQLLRGVKSRRASFLPQIVRFLRGPERNAYLVFIKPHIG